MRELGNHPLVGEARGMGLIATLEIVRDKATKEPFDPSLGVAAYAGKRAQAHGVITRALGDTVNLCPPMIITAAQIEDLLARIKLSLDDTLGWLKETGLK
jgi:4-aminobutyrate--pyruvate transaminase